MFTSYSVMCNLLNITTTTITILFMEFSMEEHIMCLEVLIFKDKFVCTRHIIAFCLRDEFQLPRVGFRILYGV